MKKFFAFGLLTFLLFSSCNKDKSLPDAPEIKDELSEGLVAFYPFNNNANDESGNGYHLSVKGAIPTDNRFGEPSKAFGFDGSTAYMVIPGLLKADSLRQLTISVWVKAEAYGHTPILAFLPKGTEALCSSYIGLDNSNTTYSTWHQMVAASTPNTCAASIINNTIENPLNKWSHIALVQRYISENTIFPRYEYVPYFNGKQLKTTGTNYGSDPIATSFSRGGVIGCNNNSGNYEFNFDFFKGSIDDIRIYNRALSDDEISQLYNMSY